MRWDQRTLHQHATATCNCCEDAGRSWRWRKRQRRGFFERDGEDADLTPLWKHHTFGAQQHVSAHTARLKIASVVLSHLISSVRTICLILFSSFILRMLIKSKFCARWDFHSVAAEVCYPSVCGGRTWKQKPFIHNSSVLLQTQERVFSVRSAGCARVRTRLATCGRRIQPKHDRAPTIVAFHSYLWWVRVLAH